MARILKSFSSHEDLPKSKGSKQAKGVTNLLTENSVFRDEGKQKK
jgi:hypothetical protein